AIIAIFLPVAFMDGMIGRFFFQFAVTISVAVALSSVEALTLAPMRCSQFLTVGERRTLFGRAVERTLQFLTASYARLLEPSLRWCWLVVIGSFAIFLASLT